MPAPDVHTRLIHPLNSTGIPCMVTGGLAAIIYGEPRLTNDVDIVMQLAPDAAGRLVSAFPAPGYDTPPVEVIRAEAARTVHRHFSILDIGSSLRADIYCQGDDPLRAWAMTRRRTIPIGSDSISVAPIEYVIVRKLEYYRVSSSDRHIGDIVAMRRISGSIIDQAVLWEWIGRLGLEPEWNIVMSRERSSS